MARTNHAEKACGDFFGQSTIIEAILDICLRLKKGSGCYNILANSVMTSELSTSQKVDDNNNEIWH